MATIVTRAGKNAPLTNAEVDANFTNLNTELGQKLEASALSPYLLSTTAASTYQPLDGDLTSIAGLSGTSGFLKKTGANTWALDTNTYLTGNQSITFSGDATGSGATSVALTLANSGVTAGTYTKVTVDSKGRVTTGQSLSSSDVTSALGYTPYNSTNPNGYITGINSSMVTTALGYTPYNSTNPSGYITSSGSITGTVNGITINQERTTNTRIYSAATGAMGLLGVNSSAQFRWQLYGDGSNYGFLDSTWGNWDIQKAVNGEMDLRVSATLRRVLHAGNYSSYALPIGGGTASGNIGTTGRVIVGSGQTSSWLDMVDTDEGTRYLHNNGGTIGFVGNHGGWTFRVADDGNIEFRNRGWFDSILMRKDINQTMFAGQTSALSFENQTSFFRFAFNELRFYDWNNGTDILTLNGDVSTPNYFVGKWDSSGRNYSREWIEFPNYSGLYSPLNGAHFYPNNVSYGSWRVAGSRNGWHGLHFDSGSTLMMNSSEVGFHRESHGWQMRWSGGTGYISKGNPGGGADAVILDSSNFTNYVPYTYPGWPGSPGTDANSYLGGSWLRSSFTYSNNSPYTGAIVTIPAGGYDIQFNGAYSDGTGRLAFRNRNGDNGTWLSWREIIHAGNIGSQSVNYASSAGSVAWTNVSGRPTNVSSFSNDSGYITSGGRAYPRRSDGNDLNFYWSGQGGQPTWLWGGNDGANMYVYNPSNFSVNYASSAGSAGTSNLASAKWQSAAIAGSQGSNVSAVEVRNNGGTGDSNLANITFHCQGYYGTSLHLRPDGYFGIGGWSASSWRWYVNLGNGDMTAAGNVTANSDERLKKDWAALPDNFVERLATVKHGTYTRIDSGERQAGASAQDMRKLLAEVVSEGADDAKTLSLAYGNAALVAAIALANRVLALEARLAALEPDSR